MAKHGRCVNIDCDHYKEEFDIQAGEDFECPHCHKPLEEATGKHKKSGGDGPNKKLIGLIAAVVALLAALGGGGYALFSGSGNQKGSPRPPFEGELTLNHIERVLKVGEVDTLVATLTPDSVQADLIWSAVGDSIVVKVSDGIVKAVKEGTAGVKVQAIVAADTLTAICAYRVEPSIEIEQPKEDSIKVNPKKESPEKVSPPKTGGGTLRLSYGTYKGETKGGYPDGIGRLTYNRSRRINRYDDKGRVAEAGDYVVGEFVRGYFIQGKWFGGDGTLKESLMIGVQPGNDYDSK